MPLQLGPRLWPLRQVPGPASTWHPPPGGALSSVRRPPPNAHARAPPRTGLSCCPPLSWRPGVGPCSVKSGGSSPGPSGGAECSLQPKRSPGVSPAWAHTSVGSSPWPRTRPPRRGLVRGRASSCSAGCFPDTGLLVSGGSQTFPAPPPAWNLRTPTYPLPHSTPPTPPDSHQGVLGTPSPPTPSPAPEHPWRAGVALVPAPTAGAPPGLSLAVLQPWGGSRTALPVQGGGPGGSGDTRPLCAGPAAFQEPRPVLGRQLPRAPKGPGSRGIN